SHADHQPLRDDGDRLHGSGTSDMKGGGVISLAVLRELAATASDRFAELALLLVCDEEWRTAPFRHGARFADYDACLCFEAGGRSPGGGGGGIAGRRGAGTPRVPP